MQGLLSLLYTGCPEHLSLSLSPLLFSPLLLLVPWVLSRVSRIYRRKYESVRKSRSPLSWHRLTHDISIEYRFIGPITGRTIRRRMGEQRSAQFTRSPSELSMRAYNINIDIRCHNRRIKVSHGILKNVKPRALQCWSNVRATFLRSLLKCILHLGQRRWLRLLSRGKTNTRTCARGEAVSKVILLIFGRTV